MQPTSASDPSQRKSLESSEAVELTIYFDSLRPGLHSSFYHALENEYVDRGLRVSHRLRAVESFGRSRRVRKDTSTELDPPMVVVAVDTAPTIISALSSISPAPEEMLASLAPTAIVGSARPLQNLGSQPAELIVHCRRGKGCDDPHGVGGVVEHMRRHGIAGATALGRGEGTITGHPHRPRLLAPSPDGPMMVVSIDQADVFAPAAPALLAMPQVELMTVKPTFLCKWRGRREPPPAPSADRPAWSRITLYTAGEALLDWRPEHHELVERLRRLGAPGVTALRGTIGYALGDPLRPDPSWYRHRRTPIVTTIVDTPDHAAQWLQAIDEITHDDGLVTHEFISAHRLM